MKKIDSFTKRYGLSKTLRFELIPQGKTAENFAINNMLEKDEQLARDYEVAKEIIDRFHKDLISNVLGNFKFEEGSVQKYANEYYSSDRDSLDQIKKELYKQITTAFADNEQFKQKFGMLFNDSIIEYAESEEEKRVIKSFKGFTTYFTGFNENRKNIYSSDGKSTEIVFRVVDQNLPKFLDNAKIGVKILDILGADIENKLNEDFKDIINVEVRDIFDLDYFSFCLSQEEIDAYNSVIGGYAAEDKTEKIKGLNEYINLHFQKTGEKLPKFQKLFKQILSDRQTVSFIPEKFVTAQELLDAINEYVSSSKEAITQATELIKDISEEIMTGIFISSKHITSFSAAVFDSWSFIKRAATEEYDAAQSEKARNSKNYEEKREKFFKNKKSYSLFEISSYVDGEETEKRAILLGKISDISNKLIASVKTARQEVNQLLSTPYPVDKNLHQDEKNVKLIKDYLDSLLNYQRFISMFMGNGDENEKDSSFYYAYDECKELIDPIIKLYNKVRNFVCSKPYSTDKIKLNFGIQELLNGWDVNKENSCRAVLFLKNNKYYLGVIDKQAKYENLKWSAHISSGDSYRKMVYKQIPSAAKYFSSKQINPQNPPSDIKKYFTKGYNENITPEQLDEKISYIINDFIPNYASLKDESGNGYFDFKFKDSKEYKTWKEFCDDVDRQSYAIKFIDIDSKYIDVLVDEGKMYLYQIYCKDFSEFSKGKKNLHTMYFEELFSEKNRENVVYKLSGGAEVFYRKASLKSEGPTHPANQPIENKNPHSNKKESVFVYDLFKDKRFLTDKYFLHLPIAINFNSSEERNINESVQRALKESGKNYVVGIDRGERNLIYVCVINDRSEIVEQISLNEIINEYAGQTHVVDYHHLLDEKEKGREEARESWKIIENIKELKEGYISQVVSKICELVEKYDAIIAIEDLNSGFKNSRVKVEKQVYQKFEKMLIDKLSFRVIKDSDKELPGGLRNGYQLVCEKNVNTIAQNGFLFYVPAWNTSKIDPVTGFVDLLKPKYENIEKSKALIKNIDRIYYDSARDLFVFDIDYDKYHNKHSSAVSKWKICTNGKRIWTHKNDIGIFVSDEVCLADEFKKLFNEYSVDINADNIAESIADIEEKDFHCRFIRLFRLTLQMRNSKTGTDIDYLISPVADADGKFYYSDDYEGANAALPCDADANGAYNIARKGLMIINRIKEASNDSLPLKGKDFSIRNDEWLAFAQKDFK